MSDFSSGITWGTSDLQAVPSGNESLFFSGLWLCCSNDVSSAPNFWTTRIKKELWLNDHSWMIGCNTIFVPICLYCLNGQNWVIVYCRENYQNCCHMMSDVKAKKAPNSISAGAPPQTPPGELPRSPADPISVLGPRASKQIASPNMYP